MPDREPCRWLLVDLGGWRKAHWCSEHHAYRHPFACFDDDGTLNCVCGVDAAKRPAPPVEQVA